MSSRVSSTVILFLPWISYIKNCTKLNKFLGYNPVLSKIHLLYINVNSYSFMLPSRSSSTSHTHWSTSGLLYGKFNSVRIRMISFLSNFFLGLSYESKLRVPIILLLGLIAIFLGINHNRSSTHPQKCFPQSFSFNVMNFHFIDLLLKGFIKIFAVGARCY